MELKNYHISICAISEKKNIKGKGNKRIGSYISIYCVKDMEEGASYGIGYLVHEKVKNDIIDVSNINDRILHVKLLLEISPALS